MIHYGIEVGSEPFKVNPGSALRRGGDRRSWHEPSRGNRSQLGYRHAIASDDKRLTSLNLSEHSCGVIAQLTLGNHSRHAGKRSKCSIS